jgi:hypothetical protein
MVRGAQWCGKMVFTRAQSEFLWSDGSRISKDDAKFKCGFRDDRGLRGPVAARRYRHRAEAAPEVPKGQASTRRATVLAGACDRRQHQVENQRRLQGQVAPGLLHVLHEDAGDARRRLREGGPVGVVAQEGQMVVASFTLHMTC